MKSRNIKFISVFLFLVIFFILPNSVGAISLENVAGSLIAKILFFIGNIFAQLGGYVFAFAAFLTKFALEFNFLILDENVNAIVPLGWRIVRDITNLGFVLVIIIIAIATILRKEEYGVKKLLPKLIGAAIVVNFSLAIAGIFIDFSHVLSNFFFNRISGSPFDIASGLASAFNPQKLLSTDPGLGAQALNVVEVTVEGFINLVFIILFTVIASFSMLALGLMLLARYLWLTFLLMISPIVWLFWIVPVLSSQFSKWWNKFLKWTFFAPAVSFFIYIALKGVETLGETNKIGEITSGGKEIFGDQSSLFVIVSHGAQMIVLVGLLIGGIILAENMGIKGAAASMKLAESAGTKARAWAGKRTANIGRRALTAGMNDKGETALERVGSAKVFGGRELRKIPLLGRAFTGLSGLSTASKQSFKAQAEDWKKKYNSRSGEDAASIASRRVTMPDEERAAAAIRAAETGKWDQISPRGRELALESIKRADLGKDLLAVRPDLATDLGKGPDGIEKETKKVPDATKLTKEVLSEKRVAINLTPTHISQIGNAGNAENMETVVREVEGVLGTKLTNIQTLIDGFQAAKASGDKTAIQDAKAQLKTLRSSLNNEEQQALAVYQQIQENANWQGVI